MDHLPGPDFVCIGAQKAGTTWLYDNLAVQGGVWVPPEKELHYFNRVCPHRELIGVEERAIPPFFVRYRQFFRHPTLATLRWLRRFYYGALSTSWYHSLFPEELVQSRLGGDITPAYSTLDSRGVRYARQVLKPSCKVLLLVRNPVDRFWSGIKMIYRWKQEDISVEATAKLIRELELPTHRLRGDYPRMVRLWMEFFSDQFMVLSYDRLVEDPTGFLQSVCDFLGIDADTTRPELTRRSNVDPQKTEMPEGIRRVLTERYLRQIEELDALIPGITRGWVP